MVGIGVTAVGDGSDLHVRHGHTGDNNTDTDQGDANTADEVYTNKSTTRNKEGKSKPKLGKGIGGNSRTGDTTVAAGSGGPKTIRNIEHESSDTDQSDGNTADEVNKSKSTTQNNEGKRKNKRWKRGGGNSRIGDTTVAAGSMVVKQKLRTDHDSSDTDLGSNDTADKVSGGRSKHGKHSGRDYSKQDTIVATVSGRSLQNSSGDNDNSDTDEHNDEDDNNSDTDENNEDNDKNYNTTQNSTKSRKRGKRGGRKGGRRKKTKKKNYGMVTSFDDSSDLEDTDDPNNQVTARQGLPIAVNPGPAKTSLTTTSVAPNSIVRFIGRNEFPPDSKLTMSYIKDLLGNKTHRMTSEELNEKFEATAKLKAEVFRFMRVTVVRKVMHLARLDPNLKDKTFKGLQKRWGMYDPDRDLDEFKEAATSYWRLIKQGASEILPMDFDSQAETEFMNQFNLRYRKDDTSLDSTKGCISMTAGVVLRNTRKKLFHYGKQPDSHGYIVSGNRKSVRGNGKSDTRYRRKDMSFQDRYFRKVSSNLQSNNQYTNEGVRSDDSSEDSEPRRNNRNKQSNVIQKKNNNTKRKSSHIDSDSDDSSEDSEPRRNKRKKESDVITKKNNNTKRNSSHVDSDTSDSDDVPDRRKKSRKGRNDHFNAQLKLLMQQNKELRRELEKLGDENRTKRVENEIGMSEAMIQKGGKKPPPKKVSTPKPRKETTKVGVGKKDKKTKTAVCVGGKGGDSSGSDSESMGDTETETENRERESNNTNKGRKNITKRKTIQQNNTSTHNNSATVEEESATEKNEDKVTILDFHWLTSLKKNGVFVCEFEGESEQKVAVKPVLFDFAEEALFLMWDKYAHSKDAIRYVEQIARGYIETKNIKKQKVVPGFTSLTEYAKERPHWATRMLGRGRIAQEPPVDKVVKSRPRKLPPGPPLPIDAPLPDESDDNMPLVVPDHIHDVIDSFICGRGAAHQQLPAVATDVINTESVMDNTLADDSFSDLLDVTGEEESWNNQTNESRQEQAKVLEAGGEGTSNNQGMETPVKIRKVGKGVELLMETPKRACESPKNHNWDEIATGTYVINGVLSGEKHCIGKRNGVVCGRLFSATSFGKDDRGKVVHVTEDGFHPTSANPAWSCKICLRGMCGPCKTNYEINDRKKSPGRMGWVK